MIINDKGLALYSYNECFEDEYVSFLQVGKPYFVHLNICWAWEAETKMHSIV